MIQADLEEKSRQEIEKYKGQLSGEIERIKERVQAEFDSQLNHN